MAFPFPFERAVNNVRSSRRKICRTVILIRGYCYGHRTLIAVDPVTIQICPLLELSGSTLLVALDASSCCLPCEQGKSCSSPIHVALSSSPRS